MKDVIRKEILYDLNKTIEILETKEQKDIEELRELSNHAIEDVALHKDFDVISITVMVYSLYKVYNNLTAKDREILLKELNRSRKSLKQNDFGGYNRGIKAIFRIIHNTGKDVKEHLQDVMQAAKIKKGTALLHKGLSIGQAAGLMGLSNWDLQGYAAKTTALEFHREKVSAKKRFQRAMVVFE